MVTNGPEGVVVLKGEVFRYSLNNYTSRRVLARLAQRRQLEGCLIAFVDLWVNSLSYKKSLKFLFHHITYGYHNIIHKFSACPVLGCSK